MFSQLLGRKFRFWSLEKDEKTALELHQQVSDWNIITFSVGNMVCVKENGNILWRKHEGPFIEYDVPKNEYTKFNLTQVRLFRPNKALY